MKHSAVKTSGMIMALALTMYLVQGTLSGLNPAIADMSAHFSNYSLSTVMLIATIPSLTAILGNFSLSLMVNKLGFKRGLLLAFAIYFIGGFLPFFTFDSLPLVLVGRGILGFGYGVLYPACATLVARFIAPGKQSSVMGAGSTIATLAGIGFTMLGGALMSVSLKAIFFVHAIAVIPLVILIACPGSRLSGEAGTDSPAEASVPSGAKVKFGGKSVFWQIFAAVCIVFYYVMYLYISLVVTDMGGSAAQSSVASSMSMAAGCISGLLLARVMSALGSRFVPVCSVIVAVGFVLLFAAKSFVVLYAACFIVGLGYMLLSPYMFVMIGAVTPAARVTSANGNAAAFMNVGVCICPYVFSFLSDVFGQADNNQFVFIISAVFFIAVAVVFMFVGRKVSPSAD